MIRVLVFIVASNDCFDFSKFGCGDSPTLGTIEGNNLEAKALLF